MTTTKRSKNSRYRGSKTHGGGSMKKRRGAGHRGGRGAAGSGKRGDAKKPSIWKNTRYAGNHGFVSKTRTRNAPVTLAHLERFTRTLQDEGYLSVKDGSHSIDLGKAGYTKLLGTGQATRKWAITVPNATDGAIEKVKKAGGTVTVTNASEEASDEGA
ncbi:MAG: uL15m family ribosomal protein [Candidatus Woesearchaeota archaeon]